MIPNEATPATPVEFLISHGLSADDANRVLDLAGCQSMEDLRLLLNQRLLDTLIQNANLKLIPAEKLRRAIQSLNTKEATKPETSALNHDDDKNNNTDIIDDNEKKLEEAIVICIDRSYSMGAPLDEVTLEVVPGAINERSRMEAVKVMFYAYRDRLQQLEAHHRIGLLQFDDEVEVLLGPPTDNLDLFEAILDEMAKRGATAIFSAIYEACQQLKAIEDPTVDLRVLVLTDGENNQGVSPEDALEAAHEIGAVVDAIIVGDRPDSNLRRLVQATGGEAFQINSLGDGFELLEAESIVSLKARRGGAEKPLERPKPKLYEVEQKHLARKAPAAKPTAAPIGRVIDLGGSQGTAVLDKIPNTNSRISGAVVKRLKKELASVVSGEGMAMLDGIYLFPSKDDITQWRALMEGPDGSPFEGGTFVLHISVPETYPFKPPRVKFETPVYHCNINSNGGICLDIFYNCWSPALNIPKALVAVRHLLANPNTYEPLVPWIAELTIAHNKSGGGDTRYYDEARRRTLADASKSVDEWRAEWTQSGL